MTSWMERFFDSFVGQEVVGVKKSNDGGFYFHMANGEHVRLSIEAVDYDDGPMWEPGGRPTGQEQYKVYLDKCGDRTHCIRELEALFLSFGLMANIAYDQAWDCVENVPGLIFSTDNLSEAKELVRRLKLGDSVAAHIKDFGETGYGRTVFTLDNLIKEDRSGESRTTYEIHLWSYPEDHKDYCLNTIYGLTALSIGQIEALMAVPGPLVLEADDRERAAALVAALNQRDGIDATMSAHVAPREGRGL